MPQNRTTRRPRSDRQVVLAITLIGATLAAFGPADPTGLWFFDVVERMGFGALVTLMTARARRWTWLVVAGAAVVLAGSAWGILVAATALGLTIVHLRTSRERDAILGAAVGAMSVQVLLRASIPAPFGLSAAVVAGVVMILGVSSYRAAGSRTRRNARTGLVGVAVFVVAATAGFAVSARLAASDLDAGLATARAGLDQATAGEPDAASQQWTAAHQHLDTAHRRLSWPTAKLAYAVPVLSQHARLVATAADAGTHITGSAARAATTAPYQSLRTNNGRFDLDRIASMREPVAETVATTEAAVDELASVSSPWLLGRLQSNIDQYRDELAETVPQARQALDAIRIAPKLLGQDGTRRYLVLFAQPAESRGLGGFIGSWAQLEADDGRLELTTHGHIDDLNGATDWHDRTITGEAEYLSRYGPLQPTRYLQNISASPDFPTVARVAEQLYPQAGGTEIDGVFYIDPIALAALLELTGPVAVDGIPMLLDSDNAADFLMHDQYLEFQGHDRRKDLLSDTADATFEALTHGELPSLADITRVMSPMVREGRLLFSATDPAADAYLDTVGLTGAFPSPDGNDLLSVRISNASTNKADYYLDQRTRYSVRYDANTGHTVSLAQVTFTNNAPSRGEPSYVLGNQQSRTGRVKDRPYGSDTLGVSIYSALRPSGMAIDGEEVGMQIQHELGCWVASQMVTIPAGASRTVTVLFEGDLDPTTGYQAMIVPQPSARPRRNTVTIEQTGRGSDGPRSAPTEKTVVGSEPFAVSVPGTS